MNSVLDRSEASKWDRVRATPKEDQAPLFWYTFDSLTAWPWRHETIIRGAKAVADEIDIKTSAAELAERFSAVCQGRAAPAPKPEVPAIVIDLNSRRKQLETLPPPPSAVWADGLLCSPKGKGCVVRKNHANAIRIFAAHPEWVGVLGFDESRHEVVKLKCPPTEAAETFKTGAEWTETDTTRATAWLQKAYGVEFATGMVLEAVLAAAEENKFDPIRQWLSSLTWDKKPRLDSFLANYFGVATGEYASAVGSKWMISAVARVFRPGCQADHVLVLEGDQGIGKSRGVRALAPDPAMVADTGIVIGDKDSYQNLRGKWIYELAELASIKGREVEKIKQFISSPSDTYRASYGRKARDWPRRVVFIGTTNEMNSYLADSTGNRRFWPVTCGTISVTKIAAKREQLWAEAVARFKANESWYLDTPALRQLASDEQDKRAQVDPWVEYITAWLKKPTIPTEVPGMTQSLNPDKGITTGDIAQGAIGLRKADTTPAVEGKIGRIMAKLDWDRRQIRRDGERVWAYFNPSPAVTGSDRHDPVTQNALN